MKTSAIVFGKGFIGSQISSYLENNDFVVHSFDSQSCDLESQENIVRVLKKYPDTEALVIAAAIPRLSANTQDSFFENARMVGNIANCLKNTSIRSVIYLSSIDVYGVRLSPTPLRESDAILPDDPYALSKVVGEFLIRHACAKENIQCSILRLSGSYGDGDKNRSTIYKMVSSAIADKCIRLIGASGMIRNFVYAKDIASIVKRCISEKKNGTWNVASNDSHSMLEVAQYIANALPFSISIEVVDEQPDPKRALALFLDISKIKKDFPGLTLTPLRKGISRYLRDAWQVLPNGASDENKA